MLVRYAFGVVLGAIATFLLFMLMQAVIANPEAATDTGVKGRIVDFVRVQEDQDVQIKKRKPKPPPPVDEPPPSMLKPSLDTDVSVGMEIGLVDVDVDVDVGGTDYSSDGEYLPIVKVAPIYPRRAQSRGIEGFVLLEFTVTTTGGVRDPSVIEAKPPGVFDRAAINAALKFKYKPKVVNGEAIEVAGVRNLITFQLED